MTLDETIDRIRGEIRRVEFRGELGSLSESDARRELIDPILHELGWRGVTRLRHEYSVETGTVDYALLSTDGKPVALVEAKAPRENLARHVDQLIEYVSYEQVDICVLTSGKLWWLYLPQEYGELEDTRFATLDLTSYHFSTILENTLAYEALMTGTAEHYAKKLLNQRLENERLLADRERLIAEIPRAWRRLLNEPSGQLTRLIEEEVFQAIGQLPMKWDIESALPDFGRSEAPSLFDSAGASVSLGEIVSAVEAVVGVSFHLNRYGQRRDFDVAKRLVMYFARKHTRASYSTIAYALKLNRDLDYNPETTVEQGVRFVYEQLKAEERGEETDTEIRHWHREVCQQLELDTLQ